MKTLRSKRTLRMVSAFVLTSFVGSLSAPVFAAGSVPAAAGATADAVGAASTKALSEMWFLWSKHLQAFQGPKNSLTPGYASQFFQRQGASPAQVDVLVGNAKSQGHLTVGTSTLAQATKNATDRIKNLFSRNKAPAPATATTEAAAAKATAGTEPAAASASTGLVGKVKSFFSRFKPAPKPTAAAASAGGGTVTAAKASSAGAGQASGSAAAPGNDPGLLVAAATKVESGLRAASNAAKGAADKVALGARRGAYAVGSTAKTGFLTAKYAIDPRPYYEIPIQGDTVLKVRGSHSSTVAFKEGKWTVQDFSYKSTWPTKGDLNSRVSTIEQGASSSSFLGKIGDKFKSLVGNVKARMRGEANITPETRAEIQRLEISNNLIDQARTISDAQRALRVRIDQMKHTSQSLRKPLDTAKVDAMEQQIRQLEGTKKDLLKKASGSMDGSGTTVIKDAAKWALYSVGITASVNLIRQAFSGEGIDIGAAFSFMTTPTFWGGTAGGFLGSTLATALATSFMPPGVGIFFKVLPGFLGAAFGFEFGSSLFGGEMDLMGTIVTTLASAGGYGLAYSLLGGAAAPGIALIGAAIAAGSLAGFLLDKFRGGPESESYILPEAPLDPGQLDAPLASVDPVEATDVKASITTANLSAAQKQVDQAYNAYIAFLKDRKIPEATAAHKAYMDAMNQLELAKANAN